MEHRFKSRIRTKLLCLILIPVIPAVTLAFFLNFKHRKAEIARVTEGLENIVRVIGAKEQAYIDNTRQLLATVAEFTPLVLGTNEQFSRVNLQNLRKILPDYVNFGIVETNGAIFTAATRMVDSTTNLSDASYLHRVVQSGQFAMGTFEPGRLTTNASVEFGLPIRDERGELKRVFFASLDLNLIAKAASSVKLPKDAIATVMDKEGTILARTEKGDEWVGKSIADKELGKNVMWSTNRTVIATGVDGVRRFYSGVTLSDGGHPAMHVLVGVPSGVLFDKPNTGLAMSLLLLAVVTAGAMGASNAFAERAILKPVENLIEGAEQIAMGDLSVRTTVPSETAELHQLSQAFNRMAMQLAAREEALKHATNEIVQLNQGLEQKVKDRTAELRAINQELESFTYSISHDLRAPLRHIDGFAQLLYENQYERLDEKGRRHLKVVSSSAKRMGALIDELLVFSRMARQELLNSEINLNETVQEAMAAVTNPNEERQIEWKVSELPVVRGDAAMMRQVWVNLLSNAVKYTSKRERASIEVGYRVDKGEFIFYVRDNGAGFDMKYADKLFGVFQRLHTDKEFEGTGIGLANVRQIITRHGGRTWAESKLNEGSTFYFSLPRS